MFENISFLFAMGFLSWAVLCLQHMIEIQKRAASNYRVELYTERPEITFEPPVSHKPSDEGPAGSAFDVSMSFWGILAVTYVLSKLLQMAERQTKKYLESLKPDNAMESKSSTGNMIANPSKKLKEALDRVAVKENGTLREQLNVLQTHCLEMRELVDELRLRRSSSSQESLQSQESIMAVNATSSVAELGSSSTQHFPLTISSSQHSQNIYMTNSHIHIQGPVFCSDSNYSTELSRQASMCERKESEFVQVWEKCITGAKERPMIAASMRCNNNPM